MDRKRPIGSPGQVGVIILLIMVVLLTIGLSVASRSSEDLFLAQQQAESTRVFNAAEAGIEEALSTDLGFVQQSLSGEIDNFSSTNVDVDYTINKVNQLQTRLFEMITVKVDVTGVSTGQGIVIDWSRDDDCSARDIASLIASVYYDDAGTTRVRHYALGGCDRGDNFVLASDEENDGYQRRATLALQTDDLFVRIKPIYADTHIRVAGDGWTLPVQYYNIRSEAANTLGNEVRAVEVNRTLDAAPSIMDYAVFSGNTLVKE